MAEFLDKLQDAGWQGHDYSIDQTDGTLYVAPGIASVEAAAALLNTSDLPVKHFREGDGYFSEDVVIKQFYHPDVLPRSVRRPEPGGIDDIWATVALETGLASINAQTEYYQLRGARLHAAFMPVEVGNGGARWALERVIPGKYPDAEYDPRRRLPHYDDRSDLCAAGLRVSGLGHEVGLDDSLYSEGHNWIVESYPGLEQGIQGSAVKIDTHMRRPTLWKRS